MELTRVLNGAEVRMTSESGTLYLCTFDFWKVVVWRGVCVRRDARVDAEPEVCCLVSAAAALHTALYRTAICM